MGQKQISNVNRAWGLSRALLANELGGAAEEFEKMLEINGLGYKAAIADKKVILTLGYSIKLKKIFLLGFPWKPINLDKK